MATLLEHYEEIRDTLTASLADKRISIMEAGRIAFAVIEAAACVVPRLGDKSRLGTLIDEAEQLYDEIVGKLRKDAGGDLIPGVPRFLEGYVLGIGRQVIRPALLGLADALEGVE